MVRVDSRDWTKADTWRVLVSEAAAVLIENREDPGPPKQVAHRD